VLAGHLGAGLNAGLAGLVQTGEALTGSLGAGLSTLVQTGGSLGVALSSLLNGSLMLDISTALSANLGGALQSLTGGLAGGLSGLVQTGEFLTGSLAGGLFGLTQTGQSLATIWLNAAGAVVNDIGGALGASLGVGLPGLLGTTGDVVQGLEGGLLGLTGTGGGVVTSVEVALRDLQLALEAGVDVRVAA
jgi:hypothetical protein